MDIFKTLILDTPDSLDNISGVLPVVNGGTGADNAPDARVNLLPNYTGNANKVLSLNGTATDVEWTSNGAGDVAGPASSTDNAVARFDSTTGKVIQNSGVTISDANLLTADALSINNNTTLGSSNSDTVTFNARIASEFTPATDNTYDLGRTGHEWRDLYIDGTANIDSLIADTADINGGTIDGTTVGATTPSTGAFTTLSSTTGANFATSSGAVGVGTASPSGKLQVVANTASAGLEDGFSVSNAIDSNCFLQCSGSAATDKRAVIGPSTGTALAFQTGASERLRIDSTGNVGIGTTSVSNKLQSAYTVSASVPAAGATGHGLGVGSSGFGLAAGALNSGNAYLQATRWDGTAANYDLILQPNGGNVGIGTTAPTEKLTVAGSVGATGDITTTTGKFATIASGQSVGLQLDGFVDGGSFNNYILNNSPTATTYAALNFGRLTSTLYGFIRSNNTSTNLEIGTAGTPRLTIDQSGNISVTGALSSTGKITSGGNIQVVAAGDLTWGGDYGAGIPVINGTSGVGFTFYPGGSTTGAVGVLNASGLAVTGALSATTTLQAKTGTTNPASSGALTGLSMGFDSNAEVSWIQSERNSLAETRSLQLNPNGGNVGIGEVSPQGALQITRTTDHANFVLRSDLGAGGGYGGFIRGRSEAFQGGQLDLGTLEANVGTVRMSINHLGNVGIGYDGSVIPAPTEHGLRSKTID
jgi:hypothetical protein